MLCQAATLTAKSTKPREKGGEGVRERDGEGATWGWGWGGRWRKNTAGPRGRGEAEGMTHRVKPSAFHTESPVFTLSSELGLKSSHLSSNPRWNTVRCSVIRGAQRKRVTGRAEGLMSDWCSHMLFTPVRNTRAERSHHKRIHVALSPWLLYWLGVQYIKTLAILLQDNLLHIVVFTCLIVYVSHQLR